MVAPSSLVILITIDCSTNPTISSCNEDSANCMCVSCPLCLKKTVWCVRSMMDSQMALQTRRAESRTDGGLELCCCDASRACSVITLRLPWGFDSDCPWNWRLCECNCTLSLAELGPRVLSAGWPTTKFSSSVSFYSLHGQPCFLLPASSSPYSSWHGIQWLSNLCWALMSMALMLEHSAQSWSGPRDL